MKKFKKFSSFFSVCLICFVILGNFSLPVLAYEKNSVNFEQVRSGTPLENSGAAFNNKINSVAKSANGILQDSAMGQKEKTGLEKSQQIEGKKKDYVDGEILVKYKNNKINLQTVSGRATALNFINSKSLEKKEDLIKNNISVLKIKDTKTVEQKITELKNDPNIEYAQPNYQYYPTVINTNDTNKGVLWGLDNVGQSVNGIFGTSDADIDAPEAWAISEATNIPVIVAVIDSGVAYNHPDLIANMWDGSSCKDENGAVLGGCNHGYDYEDGDKTPLLTISSHGTHIAGTIAAEKNNTKGIIGVAPQAKIMAIKSSLTTSDNVKSINFAKQNGAKVINASWVGTNNDQLLKDAIASFPGLFIAAVGNCGDADFSLEGCTSQNQTLYPASFDLSNIISVAATDQNDNLATFSNYGATSVDVGAPGTNILSTIADTNSYTENFEGSAYDVLVGGITSSHWAVGNDGSSKVAYSDKNIPYESFAHTWLMSKNAIDLLSGNIKGATMNFTIWCDTPIGATFDDYILTTYYSNGSWYSSKKYDELQIYLDGGYSWSDSGHIGYYKNYTEDISSILSSDFRFSFDWITDSTIDNNLGCTIDNIKIIKYSDGSDEKYGYMDGTSMAAPHVAGLAALVWGTKPSLTYTDVKNSILNTGDPLSSLAGKTTSGKRVNAFNALDSVTPPIISNVQTATTTATSTIVIWSTDLSATSKVVYSTTTPVSSIIVSTSTLVTNHSMELTGLSASTTYYFYTESSDKYGNVATSSEQSFKTLSVPDTTPPIIILNGSSTVNILAGDVYIDPGATALDDVDGDITANIIVVVNPCNESVFENNGSGVWEVVGGGGGGGGCSYTCSIVSGICYYFITYNVSDAAGNHAEQVIRTVNINPDKTIIAFDFTTPVATGVINEGAKTIAVEVPFGTDVTALTPTIIVYAGTSISPASGVAQNFTSPVIYTVTAANDSSTQAYVVTVTFTTNPDIALVAADKVALVNDSIKGANSDLSNITVALTNPLPALGANGSIISWVSNTPVIVSNDGQTINRQAFASGNATVTLTATLTKGVVSDTKVFTLTVLKLPASTIATVTSATYTVGTDTIANIPFGTAKADFLATLAKSEANQTWNDAGISNPVATGNTLVVTAQDGSTTVTYIITVLPNPVKAITAFSFIEGSGVINETDYTIAVTVPFGTAVATLVPTITIIGASVSPASGVAQDFTNPVTYTITAVDATTQVYTVTVIVAQPSDLTVLTVAIATAQSKHDVAVEGNLPGQYPAPLKANLQTAINTASAITNASVQSVVDTAVITLNTAVATFESGLVSPDTTAPIIALIGANPMSLTVGGAFTDPGAIALDNIDGTTTVVASGSVNTNVVGSYIIVYTTEDVAHNVATTTRTVNVAAVPPASTGGGGGGGGYTPLVTQATIKAGDANGDNKVDKYDFALMMSNWSKTGANVCDFNSDGKVDKYDFALLMSKWGL